MRNPYALIKQCLSEYYSLNVTQEFAKKILEAEKNWTIYDIEGLPHDTESRSLCLSSLVCFLFNNSEPPKNKNLWDENIWWWPAYGDSQEYKDEFYSKLKELVSKTDGIEFIE